MSMRPETFTKVDLTPRRHHGWNIILFILGAVLPPLAMAARFGVGKDFWINVLLTVCGYIPGQIHNFYCQNIRDNKNHRRTPKWALRYGLVDRTAIDRRAKRKQWANKYNERLPQSALVGQDFEEGQNPSSSQQPLGGDNSQRDRRDNGELWGESDERFYGQQRNNQDTPSLNTASSSGGGRWHYPYNFDQVDGVESPTTSKDKKKKKSGKKDRWARTEDAHAGAGMGDKKKKKKKSKSSSVGSERWDERRSDDSHNPIYDEPEDAVGGLYGNRSAPDPTLTTTEVRRREEEEALNHQF